MKHKVGDIVVICNPYEDFLDSVVQRGTAVITDIIDDKYLLDSRTYADDTDVVSINTAINNLESLISQAKKQLKTLKQIKLKGKRITNHVT